MPEMQTFYKLAVGQWARPLVASEHRGFLRLAHTQGGKFHIKGDQLTKTAEGLTLRRYGNDFVNLVNAWEGNNLPLYRGVSGNHFSWEELKRGEMRSPGTEDDPTFTMGASKTRWVPTAWHPDTAAVVSAGNMDDTTRELAKSDNPVPIGAVFRIVTGIGLGRPIAYLNDQEIVIDGPITGGRFNVHQIVWLHPGTAKTGANGLSLDRLMPMRPYKPKSKQEIDDWWTGGRRPAGGCAAWVDAHRNLKPA